MASTRSGGPSPSSGATDAVGRPVHGHETPGGEVEDDPDPTGGRERDEAGADDDRRDADAVRDPGGDAREEPPLAVERRHVVERGGTSGGLHGMIIPADARGGARGSP